VAYGAWGHCRGSSLHFHVFYHLVHSFMKILGEGTKGKMMVYSCNGNV
jgi:hypothetical protein